jgi:hypothetical protein
MYKGSVRGHLQESVSWPPSYCTVYSLSVHLDLHHLDADPDPDSTYHPDVDPDADSDFYLMRIRILFTLMQIRIQILASK